MKNTEPTETFKNQRNPSDTVVPSLIPSETEGGSDEHNDYRMGGDIPILPSIADDIASFVPDGWLMLGSVELDYNEDGLTDYIGIV